MEHLLVEVGSAGTPILFIDAIDRIEKEHQPVVLDVIRAIVESPLLDNWRVVVSLRDTGIEVLRNWLGDLLDALKVETLGVDQLSDGEAETLAKAKPHLRPLLFGSPQVQDIVRRPFFAKVLNQSFIANPGAPAFAPQSEVHLIENWWRRGGYNETGQSAIDRQRTLLDLAHVRARQLSQPIGLSQLVSVAHIDELRSDGILQDAREGISVRFAHDIFFEWAFFHILADRGTQWMEEIKAAASLRRSHALSNSFLNGSIRKEKTGRRISPKPRVRALDHNGCEHGWSAPSELRRSKLMRSSSREPSLLTTFDFLGRRSFGFRLRRPRRMRISLEDRSHRSNANGSRIFSVGLLISLLGGVSSTLS
ncbi:hypothetical protein WJ973_07460 [Achromobacter xylosoxidans]